PPEGFVSPMTWGVESHIIERFGQAGVPKEKISMLKDTYSFMSPEVGPTEFIDRFRRFYGPTMNAFEAAEESGKVEELLGQLVEFAEQDVVEVDRPHAVSGFLKPDVVLFQGLREEELLRLEAEGARVRDEAHQVMAGVLGVRQATRVGARRRSPDGRRRLLAEGFVRPLVVVLRAEAVKAALLAATRVGRRPGRLGLQGAVHAFMGAVLFRMARLDALLGDPEA